MHCSFNQSLNNPKNQAIRADGLIPGGTCWPCTSHARYTQDELSVLLTPYHRVQRLSRLSIFVLRSLIDGAVCVCTSDEKLFRLKQYEGLLRAS